MSYLPSDKLRVFVSSRLGECEAERKAARQVIYSLGHQPVMFEGAGARPHAPRAVYLRGLDESQIFVGIYREGYGYVAPEMEISGLEDEYRYATNLGLPRLLYVLRGAKMEARLKGLVDEFKSPELTVGQYVDVPEIGERIRNDLVALVADYFRRGRSYAALVPTPPGVLAESLAPSARRVRREHVVAALEKQLERDPVALISAPLGTGKTVFLSALAEQKGWAFVQCGEKSPQEVLADAANSIRAFLDLPAKAYLLHTEGQAALRAAWDASTSITLVLDDVRNTQTVEYVRSSTPTSRGRRLIFSSPDGLSTAGSAFDLPPLSLDEIRSYVERNREAGLMPGELVELQRVSGGNPLYLRYYTSGDLGAFATSLAEYETRAWSSLRPEAREALGYLAWASRSLTLEELSELVTGSRNSIETLVDTMSSAANLLVQSERGYSIFHPHAAVTIRTLTSTPKHRLRFYVNRLNKWFADNRDYAAAFGVLDSAGLRVPPRLLEMAARQALVSGDLRVAIRILTVQVAAAESAGDLTRHRDLLINLGHVLGLAGKPDEALKTLDDAAKIVVKNAPPIDIAEIKALTAAQTKGDRDSFLWVVARRKQYHDSKDKWNEGRLSLDISAYHIRLGQPEDAAPEAANAIRLFEQCKDEYGLRLAKANYLSAIAAIPDREQETNALIADIEAEGEQEPQRRAILCNLLGRRARERNDTSSAKAYAREAIEIGRNLGDNSIVCNNLINLGNAFRQEQDWKSAIAQYEAADKLAREHKLVVIEASAQELLASVFNRQGDGDRAVHHANYAIAIARGVSERIESNATEELARALELQKKNEEASEAWLKHGELEAKQASDVEAGSFGFIRAASLLAAAANLKSYVAAYTRLFSGKFTRDAALARGEVLLEDFVPLIGQVSLPCVFDAAVYHARLLFSDRPRPFLRRVYQLAMRGLFSKEQQGVVSLKRLRAALALSMALPKDTLRLGDIADVADLIAHSESAVSFRAHNDGAAHWTVELPFGRPVIVTVLQLDDRPDVALITLCVVLILAAFAPDILEDVLSGITPVRDEASIQVCNFSEAQSVLGKELLEGIGLRSLNEGCAVTRATDVRADADIPIFVITSDKLTENWLVGSGKGNDGQELFAMVLVELVFFLQAGDIELETLRPKIVHLVRQTIV